jgi:hypothetical protein
MTDTMAPKKSLTGYSDADVARMTADFIAAWNGFELPEQSSERVGAELAQLIAAYRRIAPPPLDIQLYHFAPLLEALADA